MEYLTALALGDTERHDPRWEVREAELEADTTEWIPAELEVYEAGSVDAALGLVISATALAIFAFTIFAAVPFLSSLSAWL